MDYDVAGRLRGVLFGAERYYLEPGPERPRYFFNENGSLFEVRSTFDFEHSLSMQSDIAGHPRQTQNQPSPVVRVLGMRGMDV